MEVYSISVLIIGSVTDLVEELKLLNVLLLLVNYIKVFAEINIILVRELLKVIKSGYLLWRLVSLSEVESSSSDMREFFMVGEEEWLMDQSSSFSRR